MTEYTEQLEELAADVTDAYLRSVKVFDLADNEDGAPADHVKSIKARLNQLHDDLACLCDYGCFRKEMESHYALYKGAKQAGLIK